MKHRLFLLYLFFISQISTAQQVLIEGRVTDSLSQESLPFVSIVYSVTGRGVVTDLDGRFNAVVTKDTGYLKFGYVGYHAVIVPVKNLKINSAVLIEMAPIAVAINEVAVYPVENPANRIIKLASENRVNNDPEKAGPFSYMAYDKMIFTISPDSLSEIKTDKNSQTTDSILAGNSNMAPVNSKGLTLQNFIDNQQLFLMETISNRKFLPPNHNKEEIITSRVSGVSQPSFVMIARQFQSFSFYDDFITIANRRFLNPISNAGTEIYFFLLKDTLYTDFNDTVFIISFRPGKGTNFDGIKGVLYINSHGYAIQNVIAEANDENNPVISVSIQQQYRLIDGKRWFPSQLNTNIVLNNVKIEKSSKVMKVTGIGKSYIMNVNLNPGLSKSDFGDVEVEIKADAHLQPDAVWNQYRVDSLSNKDRQTYKDIDSLGKLVHPDRKLWSFETLMTGYLPGRFFIIDLGKILGFNNYEGFRLGFGGKTTKNAAKWFTLGGYFAYGFNDDAFKYGGDFTLNLNREKELGITFLYHDDVTESGGMKFYEPRNLNNSAFIRDYMVKVMDKVKDAEVSFNFRSFKFLTGQFYFSHSNLTLTNNYGFIPSNELVNDTMTRFNFDEIGIRLRYAYTETFIKTPLGNKFSMGTIFPVACINVARGVNWIDGKFNYWRTEMKITESFRTKLLGETRLTIDAGLVIGHVPYSKLYVGQASYKMFALEVEQSFGTMRFNEFLSSHFLSIFTKQDFGRLLFRSHGNFQPELALVNNIGFGNIDHREEHANVEFKTLDKGYFEAGLLLNNLLKADFASYGIGAFYRYGPYSFAKTIDNFAFKFTIKFDL